MTMKKTSRVMMLAFLCATASACSSPEARRTRGGGAGADIGNRPEKVKMHQGSQQFWRTPDRIGDVQHPPLEPARQAQQLSRP